jgi:pimeloyl-ACP methyl ester carboxylesterase
MRYFFLTLLLFITSISSFGQFVDSTDFKHFSINSTKLGNIKYHIYTKHLDQKLPTILFLQGSMDLPLIATNGMDSRFYTFNREILQYSDRYHIVLMSKPGRNFYDTISLDESGFKIPLREVHNGANTQEWRVNAANLVLKNILREKFISKDKIAIIGYSEGGQVVPELAFRNKNVTHVVSVNGAGLNHFYDAIINERMKSNAGSITRQVAQNRIDSLFALYEKIYQSPNSLTEFHDEESYKRWTSYTKTDPLEYLKKLDKPILVIASGNDDSSPILGLDYIKIEFLRLRKDNLTYRIFPDSDHSFNETDEKGTTTNRRKQVYGEVFQWLDRN